MRGRLAKLPPCQGRIEGNLKSLITGDLNMLRNYTAKYTRISSGYMGQLVEWPEVVTEGKDIEDCRAMLRDALQEMVLAYQQQGREILLAK
jgi:predicted RNase H-like HicB family nuclease